MKVKIFLGLIAVLLLVVGYPLIDAWVPDTVETVITGTDSKRYNDSDMYIVYTDACTLENTDSRLFWKWNSSDMQGDIKKFTNKKVLIRKYGWRVPFLSMRENILRVTVLNPSTPP